MARVMGAIVSGDGDHAGESLPPRSIIEPVYKLDVLSRDDNIHQKIILVGLTWYRGAIRDTILRAKIDGCAQGMHTLRAFWRGHGLPQMAAQRASVIVPVAPSVISRVRGRSDIAGVLAYDLSRTSGAPLAQGPLASRWRFQKRTNLGSRGDRLAVSTGLRGDRLAASEACQASHEQVAENTNESRKTLLIVDDVLTTGFTMATIAKQLAAEEVWCIALAVTPRRD